MHCSPDGGPRATLLQCDGVVVTRTFGISTMDLLARIEATGSRDMLSLDLFAPGNS